MPFGLADRAKYELKKRREAERQRRHSAAGRDIGDLPPVVDQARRDGCEREFGAFCKTYLPKLFPLAWSTAHKTAIARMETAVLRGGLFALAMPRASGKSTLARACALWAALYGHSRYTLVVGATAKDAKKTLASLKTIVASNDRIAEDFPAACFPVRALAGVNQRAPGQLHKGQSTELVWKGDYLQFATIPGASSSGAVIDCASITGAIRGRNVQRRDGSSVRPSLVIPDDPQTKASARSFTQTQARMDVIKSDVLGLVGPGEPLAVVMPCTVIEVGDLAAQFLDRKTHPDWRGETTSMLESLPTNVEAWALYREVRAAELANDGDGSLATAHYLAQRDTLDSGAVPSWPERVEPGEASAIQHAMNLRFKLGDKAWFSEYQNKPLALIDSPSVAPRETIVAKLNRLPQRTPPAAATTLTAFVDVQLSALFWGVAAFANDWSAAVIDYGTFPEQPTRSFKLSDLPRTIQRQFPGVDDKAAIRAALDVVLDKLFRSVWKREDGVDLSLAACLVDSGWGQHAQTIYDAVRASPHKANVFASKGRGIGPADKPFSEYRKSPGALVGDGWLLDKLEASPGQRLFTFDTNHWKTRVHRAALAPIGSAGALTLFGDDPRRHDLLADHLTTEAPTETFGRGRRVDVWKALGRGDNHFFDVVVGCFAAASLRGVGTVVQQKQAPRPAQRRLNT